MWSHSEQLLHALESLTGQAGVHAGGPLRGEHEKVAEDGLTDMEFEPGLEEESGDVVAGVVEPDQRSPAASSIAFRSFRPEDRPTGFPSSRDWSRGYRWRMLITTCQLGGQTESPLRVLDGLSNSDCRSRASSSASPRRRVVRTFPSPSRARLRRRTGSLGRRVFATLRAHGPAIPTH